jgi:hypothetical protein
MLEKRSLRLLAAVLAVWQLASAAPALAQYRIINVIPFADSGRRTINSEPDIAVNPVDPTQMIVGTFGAPGNPYWSTIDGGTTWTHFANVNHGDESVGWSPSGIAYEVALANGVMVRRTPNPNDPSSWQVIPQGTYTRPVDRPALRAAQGSNGEEGIFIGMNDFSMPNGHTASIRYSIDGGSNWQSLSIDRFVPHPFTQDGPTVLIRFSGDRIYAAYQKFNSSSSQGTYNYDVVVVRDDDFARGPDPFTDLGATGTVVAADKTHGFFTVPLGNNRYAGDIALAADPVQADHVAVAYVNKIGAGQTRLEVQTSGDGGVSWSGTVFQTTTLSGLPALAITDDSTIGLMYTDFVGGMLRTHFVMTQDDFTTFSDDVIFQFVNGDPAGSGVYVGDFMDVVAVGNTFYGVFSASNNLNTASAPLGGLDPLQRNFDFNGPGGAFRILDINGNPVGFSIDPYVFIVSSPGM